MGSGGQAAGLDAGQAIRWRSWPRLDRNLPGRLHLSLRRAAAPGRRQLRRDRGTDPDYRPELLRLLRDTVIRP